MKKEFTTYWTVEDVLAKQSQMPIPRARFFNRTITKDMTRTEMVIPDDITYDALCVFIGRKTKVTIETID